MQMRVIKFAFFLALVAGWFTGWSHRSEVVTAYTDERAPIEVRLAGIAGTGPLGHPGRSPYALAAVTPGAAGMRSIGIELEPPAGESVSISGGEAELSGVVLDDTGAFVPNATVRLERVTSSGSATLDLLAGDDGAWSANGLPGGRYRVRGFVPNVLRSGDVQVRLLGPEQSTELSLLSVPADDRTKLEIIGPESIMIDTSATIAVVASRQVVDAEGLLVRLPVPGTTISVQLQDPQATAVPPPAVPPSAVPPSAVPPSAVPPTGLPPTGLPSAGPQPSPGIVAGMTLLSAAEVVTDASGASRFLLRCESLGPVSLRATFDSAAVVLSLPPCAPFSEPEATTTPAKGDG